MQTRDFILWHFQRCEGGMIHFRFIKGEERRNQFLPLEELGEDSGEMEKILLQYKSLNSFFGVATRNGAIGTKAGVLQIPALWLDLDGPPLKPIEESPFPPSAIVETSSGSITLTGNFANRPTSQRSTRWRTFSGDSLPISRETRTQRTRAES